MLFRNFVIAFVMTFLFVTSSNAQYGYGMYGGMQSCGYPFMSGDGATSSLDELKEIAENIKENERTLREKRKDKREAERLVKKHKSHMDRNLISEAVEFVVEHVADNNRTCNAYKDVGVRSEKPVVTGTDKGEAVVNQADNGTLEHNLKSINKNTFLGICPADRGSIVGRNLCKEKSLFFAGKEKIDITECTNAVNEYPKSVKTVSALDKEVKALEEYIKALKSQSKDTRKAIAEDMRDAARERTEGGICLECMTGGGYEQRETNWPGVAANVMTGLAGLFVGYKTNQMVADYNSSIGYATQPNLSAMSMGFPYIANGIYGALGGGIGAGAFGCGNTFGGGGNWNGPYGMTGPFGMGGLYNPMMGGMWGYPQGMMGAGMGGGMFMPGMGPWGMNGPWGLNPYGMGMFPGAGNMVAGGFGFQMPGYGGMYPWGGGGMMGIPGMGVMMGGAMGFPGYGLMMAGGVGIPMMGGMGMGMPMTGGMGMGMPMMGGMGMGMPMMGGMGMGMPMTGGMGMGMPMMGGMGMGMPMMGGMGNMMMGNMMMGNMMMGNMMMGNMMMGNMMMGNMMSGNMMSGNMMTGGMGMDMGGFQMQQQMMQMQMQQYQMQMQQQSRYYENYMQRQRAMSSLQQELMGLMNRIQMVQSGSMSGGFGGGFSGGFSGGGYLGIGTMPYNGGGSIAAPPGTAAPPPLGTSYR